MSNFKKTDDTENVVDVTFTPLGGTLGPFKFHALEGVGPIVKNADGHWVDEDGNIIDIEIT